MAADGITLPHRDVLLTASQVMGELSVVCLWGCQSSSSVCIWEKGRAHSSVDSWSEGNWRMKRTFHKLTGLWCNNWMNRVTLSISISHDWVYRQWNIQANVTWLHAPILKTRLHTYLYKQTNYIYFFQIKQYAKQKCSRCLTWFIHYNDNGNSICTKNLFD